MNLPALPDTFYWTHESWGPALRCRPLDAVAPHLFTTRQLELRGSQGPSGWKAVAAALEVAESDFVRLQQVHGKRVVVIRDGDPAPSFEARPEADMVVSGDARLAIVVQAADCVPLLLADPTTGVVAAVHAGWRGTAVGAARSAVEALQHEFGVRPANLVAAIGPSIGACCYEVGPELVDAFVQAWHRDEIDRWFTTQLPAAEGRSSLRLDLWTANRDQLVMVGVRGENVHTCGLCTASNLDVLYSYRAEGAGTGRLVGAIRRRGST